MFKDFFHLNKNKLLLPSLFSWIIFFVGISLASQLFPGGGEKVSLQTGVILALIYATAITAMVVIISLLGGLYEFYQKRKAFNLQNLKEFFERNKFEKAFINAGRKLIFTGEVKSGSVKGIPVIADIVNGERKFVMFQFLVYSEPINRQEYKMLEKKFKQYNAFFEVGYIFKKIPKHLSASEIESSLAEFASLLRSQKFIPVEFQSLHSIK